MTKRIGLAAVFTLGSPDEPLFGGLTDDTPAKDGIDAKAAFKKLTALVDMTRDKRSG
jgi:hypothetical protein